MSHPCCRPIFDQKSRKDGRASDDLLRSLRWWKEVLRLGIAEKRPWKVPPERPVHLFCDASSTPPYLGAVVLLEDEILWTHMSPPANVLHSFLTRRDKQIMGLELLAISMALDTFDDLIRGRKVVVHTDNKGSEMRVHLCLHSCLNRQRDGGSACSRHRSGEAQRGSGTTLSSCTMSGCTLPSPVSASTCKGWPPATILRICHPEWWVLCLGPVHKHILGAACKDFEALRRAYDRRSRGSTSLVERACSA